MKDLTLGYRRKNVRLQGNKGKTKVK